MNKRRLKILGMAGAVASLIPLVVPTDSQAKSAFGTLLYTVFVAKLPLPGMEAKASAGNQGAAMGLGLRANCILFSGNNELTLAACDQALSRNPIDEDAYTVRGIAHLKKENYEQADVNFRTAAQIARRGVASLNSPKVKSIQFSDADSRGLIASLIKSKQRTIRQAQENRALALLCSGNNQKALEACNAALAEFPQESTRSILHEIKLRQGKFGELEEECDKNIKAQKRVAYYHNLLARCQMAQDKMEDAIDNFTEAIESGPSMVPYYRANRAEAYQKVKNTEQAEADLKEAAAFGVKPNTELRGKNLVLIGGYKLGHNTFNPEACEDRRKWDETVKMAMASLKDVKTPQELFDTYFTLSNLGNPAFLDLYSDGATLRLGITTKSQPKPTWMPLGGLDNRTIGLAMTEYTPLDKRMDSEETDPGTPIIKMISPEQAHIFFTSKANLDFASIKVNTRWLAKANSMGTWKIFETYELGSMEKNKLKQAKFVPKKLPAALSSANFVKTSAGTSAPASVATTNTTNTTTTEESTETSSNSESPFSSSEPKTIAVERPREASTTTRSEAPPTKSPPRAEATAPKKTVSELPPTKSSETSSSKTSTEAQAPATTADGAALIGELESMVKKWYPRAKVTKTDNTLHFEFKAATLMVAGKQRKMLLPQSGGIVGDITLKSGKYQGKEVLPCLTNEYGFVSLLLAPHSNAGNCHLHTILLYPPDAPIDFVDELKALVATFEK